jgi:hypothetical protein
LASYNSAGAWKLSHQNLQHVFQRIKNFVRQNDFIFF